MTALNFPIRVFFDSDVVIAGSASSSGASYLLLQLSELGLIRGIVSGQVLDECRRNIKAKLPAALPIFNKVIERALQIQPNPSQRWLSKVANQAHPKDIPILAAALRAKALFLVTFNVKDYKPLASLGIGIVQPGEMLQNIRENLS